MASPCGNVRRWNDFLSRLSSGTRPVLEVYTDGSWSETQRTGGYAAAFVMQSPQGFCLCGADSDQTHGSATTEWPLEAAPPALRNEEIAIAAALLWLQQSPLACHLRNFTRIDICFDCLSAGNAACGEPHSFSRESFLQSQHRWRHVWPRHPQLHAATAGCWSFATLEAWRSRAELPRAHHGRDHRDEEDHHRRHGRDDIHLMLLCFPRL